MIIRRFRSADVVRVFEISNMCFNEAYEIKSLLNINNMGMGFFVAEEDGIIVGYIIFGVNTDCNGYLISIAVDKNYRGLKIGSNLLKQAIMIYIQHGINKIVLEVKTHNINAIKFYESFGFVIDRREFNYYADGSDAYIMYFDCPC